MNKLEGNIVLIESSAWMSIVDVKVRGDIFSAILLDVPAKLPVFKKRSACRYFIRGNRSVGSQKPVGRNQFA